MKRMFLTLVCASMVFALGCVPMDYAPNVTQEEVHEVKLSQDTIDEAVEGCKNQSDWGVPIGKIRINYISGVKVEAAVVLHNGNDCERMIYIIYQPTYEAKYDMEEIDQLLKDEGISDTWIGMMELADKLSVLDGGEELAYSQTPAGASGWVLVAIDNVRLKKMQTEVVPIYLLVPKGQGDLPKRWEFRIWVAGVPISQYQYKILVTTIDNDTVLEQHLPMPLLGGSLESILSIVSSEDENPYATDYDPGSGILTIEGLKESTVRELTITYEYGENVALGYSQRWLITMLE